MGTEAKPPEGDFSNFGRELNQNRLPLCKPEEVLKKYTPRQIGEIFSYLLDSVYEGRSDRINGHFPEKFQQRVDDKILYPFIVFDGQKPIACYAVQWYGEKIDMGNAAVLPEYRGTNLISGKELYIEAHRWVESNLSKKAAIITGGSRIPISAAIAINNCGRFPCWLPPFPSWGYKNEPLEENNDRKHEFLLVSESYPRGNAYAPEEVFLPKDKRVSSLIKGLWQEFSEWNNQKMVQNFKISNLHDLESGFTYSKGDTERVRYALTKDDGNLDLNRAEYYAFVNPTGTNIPKTRGIAIDVPADNPYSSMAQDFLIQNGFVFAGIYPGIKAIEVSNPDGTSFVFERGPVNIYGKLRPGLKDKIQKTEIPHLKNEKLEKIYNEIYLNWLK